MSVTDDEIVLRGDEQCPHGNTARKKCVTCDHEDELRWCRQALARELLRDHGNSMSEAAKSKLREIAEEG